MNSENNIRPIHIAIGNGSLCYSRGGTERVATNLSAALYVRGHKVTLLSLILDKKTSPVYEIADGVQHLSTKYSGKQSDINALRERILKENVDVFLALESGSNFLYWAVLCNGSGIPLICSERCDPIRYIENIVWHRAGRYAALSGADVIHELLPSFVDTVPDFLQNRVCVIPNTLPTNTLKAYAEGKENQRKILLYLARFADQKRPEILVEAFEIIAHNFPEWDLVMWGHGPNYEKVKTLIDKSVFKERIYVKGECTDSASAYANAQIYCLPSAYEGFPNSVLEAMCAKLPVVGFAACSGLYDVVEHEKTGLLAFEESAEALSKSLATLMESDVLRKEMGEYGYLRAHEKYSPEEVYTQWEKLLYETSKLKGNTVLDSFTEEPFIYQARLLSAARAEYLLRTFGTPMPYSIPWWWERMKYLVKNVFMKLRKIA